MTVSPHDLRELDFVQRLALAIDRDIAARRATSGRRRSKSADRRVLLDHTPGYDLAQHMGELGACRMVSPS